MEAARHVLPVTEYLSVKHGIKLNEQHIFNLIPDIFSFIYLANDYYAICRVTYSEGYRRFT